jgi:hypothetical protein
VYIADVAGDPGEIGRSDPRSIEWCRATRGANAGAKKSLVSLYDADASPVYLN